MARKKQREPEKRGIFGDAVDYSVYHMNFREKMVGYLLGAVVGGVVFYVFVVQIIVAIIAAVAAGFMGVKVYGNRLQAKRKEVLLIQFKDLLESLCTSFGSGRNTVDAFHDAYQDLYNQFGEDGYIVRETKIILSGLQNNYTIEEMLRDFSDRCDLEDIRSFADVFEVTNRLGGNIMHIINETRNIIVDKVNIQLEIQTLISGTKNELNIMIIMPLIVVTQTQGFTDGAGAVGVLAKLGALVLFVGAYVLGQKMIRIKV